jgi:hypothetical protein
MRLLSALFAFVVLSAVVGCGPAAKLSGQVTFDGQPMKSGTVVFMSDDKQKTEQAAIEKNGTYTIDRLTTGKWLVAVMPTQSPMANMPKGVTIPEEAKNTPQGKMYLEAANDYVNVQNHQRDPTTSNITVNVEGGEQKYDIPLTSAK